MEGVREYVQSLHVHVLEYMEKAKNMIDDPAVAGTEHIETLLDDIHFSKDQLALETLQVARELRDARASGNAETWLRFHTHLCYVLFFFPLCLCVQSYCSTMVESVSLMVYDSKLTKDLIEEKFSERQKQAFGLHASPKNTYFSCESPFGHLSHVAQRQNKGVLKMNKHIGFTS